MDKNIIEIIVVQYGLMLRISLGNAFHPFISSSCLRADVSYFLCCTRATKEIGDVCTQANHPAKVPTPHGFLNSALFHSPVVPFTMWKSKWPPSERDL